jgi:hypothetical protein
VIARQLHASFRDRWSNRFGEPRVVTVLPEDASRVLPQVQGPVSAFLGVLQAAVALVLLLARSNVANLLLARANARRAAGGDRERGVRASLLAGPGRPR